MEERTIPFREDKSKVLVSAVIRHEGPRSVEPKWSGDRGDDYGEELWFDLKHGSFLKRQTHRVLRYDIDTGEDTSWYYPDKVDEFSILDLPSTGFDIDSIDDGTPWYIAGPIADYLRNPTPLQAIESLTAIYRSKIGMGYWNDYADWKKPHSLVSDSICILPDSCSSQLAEQILTDFANSPDDGLTSDEAGVTQMLSKLDYPTGEISGETRSVIRSFRETLERLYDRESGRTLNWYHPASGRLVTRTFNDAFELYDTPIPHLAEGASVNPDLRLGTWLQIDGSFDKDVSVRSVAKSIATEDGWIGVDGDRTVGDLAAMVADITPEMASGQPVAECSQSAVEAIPSEKPRDASVSVEYVTELEEAGALLNEDRNEIAVSWLPYDEPEILVFDCSAEKLAQACLKEVEDGLSRGRTVDEILDELYCQNFVGGADGIHFKASFEGIRELSESGFFICSDSQKLINASSLRDLNAIVANQFPGTDLFDMAHDNAGSSLDALVSEKETAVRLRVAAHKPIAPTAAHPEQESI